MSIPSIPVRPQSYQIVRSHESDVVQIPLSVRIVKRGLDLALSLIGLVMCLFVGSFVALLIRLDSPGPVFYRQRRAGALRGGPAGRELEFEEFEMLKFRTMRDDAEKLTSAVVTEENDPRVTGVGRWLRRTRLDELPQLWNVLRGDMSMVGPRPERPELLVNLALAIPFFEERMRDTKPGITGLAQVSLGYAGRPTEGSPVTVHVRAMTNPFGFEEAEGALADDMRTKLLFDLAYVASLERFTTFIVMELGILLRTPWVMVRGLGR